ncbi:MAG: BamA/TamA family outer membrane protein [Spirochaetes bacterium]|nr:BamA/TamA family outer membrane protein [Spirochaetota bacterium]
MRARGIFALLIFLSLLTPAGAQTAEEPDSRAEDRDVGVVPLPVVGYSQDTGTLFGAAAFIFWQPATNVTSTTNNTLSVVGFYGTRNVVGFPMNLTLNLADGLYRPELGFFIGRAPSDFYGIGPDAELDDEEVYTSFTMDAEVAFLFRLYPQLYAGPAVNWIYQDVLETEDGGILDTRDITGNERIRTVGAGARIDWDTREPQLYPFSGRLLSVSTIGYPGGIASHAGYTIASLDYRRFFNPWGRHVIALQGKIDWALGDTPVHYLPYLGGSSAMRGYPEGRYRDDIAVQGQLEYRFPIVWRFGGVVFGAAGQVAPSIGELEAAGLPLAGGLGLRFALNTEENINLRIDFAVTREGTGFYVNLREAF